MRFKTEAGILGSNAVLERCICCKAPLWGGYLEGGYLNPTPRFVHRPHLLLWLVIMKKGP